MMQESVQGGCACGAVRYALLRAPLVVHACHCRDCQRLSGSFYAVNAWIERDAVSQESGTLTEHELVGGSGAAHRVFACERCATQLWSRYMAGAAETLFVRVGTLDEPNRLTADVHVFTRSKHPSVVIPPEVPSYEAFYSLKEVWPAESRARLRAIMPPR